MSKKGLKKEENEENLKYKKGEKVKKIMLEKNR